MKAVLVRLARAVACKPRLRLLTLIIQCREISPTALSAQLPMRKESVTNHLKELTAVGLITRRPAGSFNYACSNSAYSIRTPSGRMAVCLQAFLSSVDTEKPEAWADAVDRIFRLATAFTHVRRLTVLSMLARREHSTAEIRTHLHMSKAAFSRHCTKIVDREFASVTQRKVGCFIKKHIPFASPLHRSFWQVFITPPAVAIRA